MTLPARCRAWAAAAAIAVSVGAACPAPAANVDQDASKMQAEAARADYHAAMRLAPDVKHGADLFSTCAACHGAAGLGADDGSIPAVAGQHVTVLVKQLADFRHDRRWGDRMRGFASQHHLEGPQDLLDVSAYAASLARWPPLEGGTGDGSLLKEGFAAYHRACAKCHGPLGLGDGNRQRPRLAGQHYLYLLRQLEETADGMRPGMDVEHVKLIGALSAEERRAVADYLSRLSPHLSSTRGQPPESP